MKVRTVTFWEVLRKEDDVVDRCTFYHRCVSQTQGHIDVTRLEGVTGYYLYILLILKLNITKVGNFNTTNNDLLVTWLELIVSLITVLPLQ